MSKKYTKEQLSYMSEQYFNIAGTLQAQHLLGTLHMITGWSPERIEENIRQLIIKQKEEN